MDHLPVPPEAAEPPHKVLLRCDPSSWFGYHLDPPSFTTYPESQGKDPEVFLFGDVGDVEATESFLQQWLFFGLLYEVVNSCGPVLRDFEGFISVDEDGTRLVTTALLPQVITGWQEAKNALPTDQQLIAMMHVDNILTDARFYIGKMSRLAPNVDILLPMDGEIQLSIIVLGETLDFSKANIFKDLTGGQPTSLTLYGNEHWLGWLLREQGCCPEAVRMLEATASAGTMYYAYRSGLLRDRKDHAKCSEDSCAVYQVDTTTYKTAHVGENCDCPYIEAPMGKVRQILSEGSFPVITISSTSSGLVVDAVKPSPGVVYTAISHVWSDGLGNPRSNALPGCQLQYIMEKVLWRRASADKKESQVARLWIDTLCVPLDEPLRGRAIELIKTTFAGASEVLVFDARLQKLSALVHYTESLMRIKLSSWFRRLWTFLEGVLARNLYFQFADGSIDMRVWQFDRYEDTSTNLWNLLPVEASQVYWILRRLDRLDSSQRISRLWDALQWRSTSRMSDESICVASLFELDLGQIVRTPQEQRMHLLIQLQKWFPQGIIFMDTDRLETPGLRWAPKSFLARQSSELGLLNDERPAVRYTEHGLPVVYPGFLLTVPKRPLCSTFLAVDEENASTYQVAGRHQAMEKWRDNFSPHVLTRPAIITSRQVTQNSQSDAILVDIVREEHGCLYATFVARTFVSKTTNMRLSYAQHAEHLRQEAELEVDEYLYASAVSLPSDQQWCVG